jgi:hypothetical protein
METVFINNHLMTTDGRKVVTEKHFFNIVDKLVRVKKMTKTGALKWTLDRFYLDLSNEVI